MIHSEDDQIVPYADAGPLTAKLLKNGTLKTYKDLPHGCCQTHPEVINPEILAFIQHEETTVGSQPATATPVMASAPRRARSERSGSHSHSIAEVAAIAACI